MQTQLSIEIIDNSLFLLNPQDEHIVQDVVENADGTYRTVRKGETVKWSKRIIFVRSIVPDVWVIDPKGSPARLMIGLMN